MFDQITKNAKILIIDDNETMISINKKALETIGYANNDKAAGGQRAIEMIEQELDLGNPYELLLLDWNMPEVSGIDVLRFCRKHPIARDVFIVMVTAESNRENILLAVQEGLDDYIVKPFAPNTVIRKFKSLAKKGLNNVHKLAKEFLEAKNSDIDTSETETRAQIERIKQRFLHAIKFDHQNQQEILHFSKFLIQGNQFKDATKLIQYVLSLNPVNPDAHYLIAKICFLRGNYQEAEKQLHNALSHRQDNIPALQLAGELALRNGNFNVAKGYFTRVIMISEKQGKHLNETMHSGMGQALAGQNENDEAASHFKRSITLNPEYISAYYNLMTVYNKNKEINKALSVFEKAKQISPKNSQEWVELGKMYIDCGETEKADFAFQNAEKKEPENNDIRNQIGEKYQQRNMPEKALRYFKKSVDHDAQNPDSLNLMGIAFRKTGNFEKAIEAYEKALQLDSTNKQIHYNLSAAFVEAGDPEKAKIHLKQALEIDPDFQRAKVMYQKLTDGKVG